MKLKKIASLMLAGIMAVSMLAGCNGKTEENPGSSSSEVTVVNGAASAINNALSQNKDVVKFESDENLDKNLQAYFKLNPIKGDTWVESNYGGIGADNAFNYLKSAVGFDYDGVTNYNTVMADETNTYVDKSAAIIGMFNSKVYTQDDALKMIGKAVDNYTYAEDIPNSNDGKMFSYSGKASVIEVSSEGGTASVWVVVAVVTKEYTKV